MRSRCRRPLSITLVFFLALLTGCATSKLISDIQQTRATEADVQAAGRENHAELVRLEAIYEDEKLAAYVSRVGQRMVAAAQSQPGSNKQLIYRFYVLDDPDSNAYALPGGYVYINRGLLPLLNNEDELAAVIGHELAHIQAGHALKRAHEAGKTGMLSSLGSVGLQVLGVVTFNPVLIGLGSVADTAGTIGGGIYGQSYEREREFEADRLGKQYLTAAGYAPNAMERIFRAFAAQSEWDAKRAEARGIKPQKVWGVLESHPDDQARIAALRAQPAAAVKTRAPEADFLTQVDGLTWGLSSRIGVHRGGRFYSRSHQLVIPVPNGWFVGQSPDEQSALFMAPKNSARNAVVVQDLASRQDATQFASAYFDAATLNGSVRTIAGQSVWRGTVTPRFSLGKAGYEAAAWTTAERGYVVVGARNSDSPISAAAWVTMFDKFVAGVRPLRADEASLARSVKLSVIKMAAKSPTKYRKLAEDAPLGSEAADMLRLINGQYPGGEPAAGARVKVLR